jgi:hypothetical protein
MPGVTSSPSNLAATFGTLLNPKHHKLQAALNAATGVLGKGPARSRRDTPKGPAVPETSLWEFVTTCPWQIDRHDFDWAQHRYLQPVYEAVQVLPGVTDSLSITVIKGAQVGMSIWAMLGMIYLAVKFPAAQLGYFLPDQSMSQLFSVNRFKPLIESNSLLGSLLGTEREGTNNTRLRTLGDASIYFSYMGGTTSTESLPLMGIYFDEVRRMNHSDIALAEQRISHSRFPVNIKLSTAGFPDADIDYYYHFTDQREWHTSCQCHDGVMLAEIWPESIGLQGEEVFFRCPKCDTKITDPQHGRFIAHAPQQRLTGFRIPQTVSLAPLHQPKALWTRYTNPKEDRGEFYRSVLARPYVDPESQLVTEADLQACENTDVRWEQEGTNCAMGIDQMGGFLDVVVLAPARREKLRLVHLERLEGDDPFDDGRLDRLMRQYDVSVCVCDLNPSWNESMRFAKRWVQRCWLVTYSSAERADMFAWRDRRKPPDQTPNEPDVKFKYVVTLQRYKALDYALGLFKERLIDLPHRRGLVQTIHDDHGLMRPVFMAEELFWPHMQRVIRQKHVMDEATGVYKMEMIKVGSDPHYAFAFTYAVCAASRSPGGRFTAI